jgi:hypothetical protein
MDGVAMVKFTLLVSLTFGFTVQATRIRALVVAGPVTTQLKLPPEALEF